MRGCSWKTEVAMCMGQATLCEGHTDTGQCPLLPGLSSSTCFRTNINNSTMETTETTSLSGGLAAFAGA